ncbi:MAG TPA: carboxypeptidase regulatory-like domain-containing protein [Stellaceae bacterium]|nr:carboxypeptidase regulatory-like domain-containing protein [Stellaceae bacterium]
MHKSTILGLAALIAALASGTSHHALAAGKAVALSGTVSSAQEGAMEGVVVSARKAGSTIEVSVVSGKDGRYSFPADHLSPGHYAISIRAVGYDLDGMGSADVAANAPATQDLTLKKTKNLPAQLTNAEWMLSVPGTDAQKASLLNCNGCHTIERVMRSTHTADEWMPTIRRMMHYTFQSQPVKPVQRMDPAWGGTPEQYREQATYLATINLSATEDWSYPLKTMPRPTGRATRVIVTSYDLPRPTIEPHDVVLDKKGVAWYSDFGELKFGRLDPKSGKVAEYDMPNLKAGFPEGALDLERDPYNGTFWMGMMYQPALANFDPAQNKFVKSLQIPEPMSDKVTQLNMLGLNYKVDGKIWTNNAGNQDIYRIDVKTGKWETFKPLKELPGKGPYSVYGIASDRHNNLYFTEFSTNYIGRIDAKTLKVTWYQTPSQRTRPRRIEFDNQDRLWIAEYGGNAVGMFDTKTEKFAEYKLPTPFTAPYYATTDKNGEVWTGGMTTDRVVRLDPKTGTTVEYLMPGDTNIRRVYVDNSTTPVTFWTGANHTAKVIKVEPLD